MPDTITPEQHVASFQTAAFKDGEAADGSPTAEEQAAAAANARPAAENGDDTSTDDAENSGTGDDGADASDAASDADDAAAKDEEQDQNAQKSKNDEAKPPKKADANKRIGDLTAARRTAEREAQTQRERAERAEAALAAVKSGKAPLTQDQGDAKGGAVPPDPSKFEYGELDPKYIAAVARHETTKVLAAQKAEDEETRQAAAADAKRQETAEKTDKLVRAGIGLHDDFDDVVMQGAREGKWDLSATVGELILDSEFGPQIAYDLASDPDESRRVAKLSPSQQAAWFGKQEAKFEAAKPSQTGKAPAKTPQAPPPPKTPRGGSGSNTVEADSQDFAAVEKAWRSGALH